jgi:hypothetical protein
MLTSASSQVTDFTNLITDGFAYDLTDQKLAIIRGQFNRDAVAIKQQTVRNRNHSSPPNNRLQDCGTTASTSRVIVRFNASSVRRIAAILLMECRTVLWCLPPNSRPISCSDALSVA